LPICHPTTSFNGVQSRIASYGKQTREACDFPRGFIGLHCIAQCIGILGVACLIFETPSFHHLLKVFAMSSFTPTTASRETTLAPVSSEMEGPMGRSFAPPAHALTCSGPESEADSSGGVCEMPETLPASPVEGGSCEMPGALDSAESEEGGVCEMPEAMEGGQSVEAGQSLEEIAGGSHICLPADPEASPEWDDFAFRFNEEFQSILHVFETDTARCSPEVQDGLSGGQLALLFTVRQRDLLNGFFSDHRIPNRLFNGDEIGSTNTQQRLLMSAHILARGTYSPGSFDQRMHARMCFHWVRIVHHYAGASPGLDGSLEGGVMGNFDHEGNLVLGSGRRESVFGRHAAGAGEASTPNGTATMPLMDVIREVQPGDWLYYYNANGGPDAAGNHSVMFSHWEDTEVQSADGIQYMTAVVFSQNNTAGGGREHTARLGERFSGAHHIFPVVNLMRATDDSNSATDYRSLFPSGGAAATANIRYLADVQRRTGFLVDSNALLNHLRIENEGHILALSEDRGEDRGGIITPDQVEMLRAANLSSDVEVVVRLTQRLRQWVHNAGVLETGMRETYEGTTGERPRPGLNERHAESAADVKARSAPLSSEIADIDAQLAPLDQKIEELTNDAELLNIYPRIRDLRRQIPALNAERDALPRGSAERAEVNQRRSALIAEIERLSAEYAGTREGRNAIRDQLRALRAEGRPLRNRRTRLADNLAAIQREQPEGMVHPGRLRGNDDRSASTGRLEALFPRVSGDRNMRPFLSSTPAPRPAPRARRRRR
jgi:predicted  nucleic acid-binding Zn-ribbon protein